MKISHLRTYIRFRKWGKYLITILVFLIVYLFVGDQSLIRFSHRRQQIKHIEKQTQTYRRETQKAERTIQMLNSKDSLERYARELYYMHNDNEDVYIVEE